MRVLTIYTDSHKYLYKDYFLLSFNEHLSDHKLVAKYLDQYSDTGVRGSDGFGRTMIEKIEFILENIDIENNEPIIFSDCDVYFFDELEEDMLGDFDIKFLQNNERISTGFMIFKQNEKVKEFFEYVLEVLNDNTTDNSVRKGIDDQFIINSIFKQDNIDLKHGFLNENYINFNDISVEKIEEHLTDETILYHCGTCESVLDKEKIMRTFKYNL